MVISVSQVQNTSPPPWCYPTKVLVPPAPFPLLSAIAQARYNDITRLEVPSWKEIVKCYLLFSRYFLSSALKLTIQIWVFFSRQFLNLLFRKFFFFFSVSFLTWCIMGYSDVKLWKRFQRPAKYNIVCRLLSGRGGAEREGETRSVGWRMDKVSGHSVRNVAWKCQIARFFFHGVLFRNLFWPVVLLGSCVPVCHSVTFTIQW